MIWNGYDDNLCILFIKTRHMEKIIGLTLPLLTIFVGFGFLFNNYYLYGGIMIAIGIFLFIVRFRRRKKISGKYF